MAQKIGIIGSGAVGKALAKGLLKHGYEIMIGTNDSGKHDMLGKDIGDGILIGDFATTAAYSDYLILAVKGIYAESALEKCGLETLKGKTILDACNPIDEKPPVKGVLSFFTSLNQSLLEILQMKVPDAHFVKCFSCVGSGLMVDPAFDHQRPSMFICGNQAEAKQWTTALLTEIGWDTEDMGEMEAARAIEPLCILWCMRGFNQNQWSHAFKLLKA